MVCTYIAVLDLVSDTPFPDTPPVLTGNPISNHILQLVLVNQERKGIETKSLTILLTMKVFEYAHFITLH